jgi:hypothetical protein
MMGKKKKISSIGNPRKAKRKSKIARKNIKMKHAQAASKATGKSLNHFLKMYDYFKL